MKVDVLLGSYNGEGYIREQIDSILGQSFKNISLLIRDDGSTDETVNIIREYSSKDSRVKIIEDNKMSKGVGENFKSLLLNSNSDYVLFSDQDDIWFPEKVETLVNFAEENFNENLPSIVYSSGLIVDSKLNETGNITDKKLSISSIGDMLISNGGVQGCAILMNKALSNSLKESSDKFFWHMHDQVATLFAASFGSIFYLPKPLFLYRQHGSNVKGYHRKDFTSLFKKSLNIDFIVENKSFQLFVDFYNFYESKLTHKQAKLINSFINLKGKRKFLFLIFLVRNKINLSKSLMRGLVKSVLAKKIYE
ncbi:glycosyltransferase family 2 protein [Vibrio sp. TH_r3]|uniref:glycosyltransferase family 2 protein n=1 Tax=Vibrio sp. TH_r3 TaxID=3082084 RepID=UPI0029548AA8|nr:glycosyltransferase family 2 protein [Vibrio sp. TH_r3]MDV7106001.1 glycosyltransferase family 2 protein [Vibrio sp. TH_r3]